VLSNAVECCGAGYVQRAWYINVAGPLNSSAGSVCLDELAGSAILQLRDRQFIGDNADPRAAVPDFHLSGADTGVKPLLTEVVSTAAARCGNGVGRCSAYVDRANLDDARTSRVLEEKTGTCGIGVDCKLTIRNAGGRTLICGAATKVLVGGHALTPLWDGVTQAVY